jgi:flagellar biosynthesis/type III secretory pathway protein FliH
MGMIRNALAGEIARDAVVLDLGDLRAQAAAIRRRAEEEAQRIAREAKEERERIVAGAREEGFERGRAEGLEQGLREGREAGRREALEQNTERIEALTNAWEAALGDFERSRDALRRDAREDVLRLALRLSEKVAKRAIEVDERAASRQVEAALEMALASERMTIRIHPEDRVAIEADLPAIAARVGGGSEATLVEDASLPRGSCVVRTERGEVDGNIDHQIARLVDALLPLGRSDDAGAAGEGESEEESS